MNRREIKKLIAFKIWTTVPRIEKYKIGAVGSDLRDYPLYLISRRFIYERSATNIRDWLLAYSFMIRITCDAFYAKYLCLSAIYFDELIFLLVGVSELNSMFVKEEQEGVLGEAEEEYTEEDPLGSSNEEGNLIYFLPPIHEV